MATFIYSGTFKGKPVSGKVSGMAIRPTHIANLIYGDILNSTAKLTSRRNDWDCGQMTEKGAYLFRTMDKAGNVEMRVEFRMERAPVEPEPAKVEPAKPDPRAAFKAAYGEARKRAHNGRFEASISLSVGPYKLTGRAFTGRTLQPAIIRDRSIPGRIASELHWAAYYRGMAAKRLPHAYFAEQGRIDIEGALACIRDARNLRATASAFQAIP